MARYSKLQASLRASILSTLYKGEAIRVPLQKFRESCPSLVHDAITDEDLARALTFLSFDGYLQLGAEVDLHVNEHNVEWPKGFDDLRGEERAMVVHDIMSKHGDMLVPPLSAIWEITLTESGSTSLDRRKDLKGDIFRKIYRMDDEQVEDYFEELLSDFDTLDPIRYNDANQIVDLNKNPKIKEELVDQLTNLTRMIETSNAAMSMKSQELEKAVAELKAGTEIVKSGKFSVGKIEGALFGALTYLTSKFADAPIGDAAQFCWSLLKTAVTTLIA